MPEVLALDIGSGGVTAARIDSTLGIHAVAEDSWHLQPDANGSATLSPLEALESVNRTIAECTRAGKDAPGPEAIVISSMMHTLVLTDGSHHPRTPVSTWLDTAALPDEDGLRRRLGPDYTFRTGAFVHPSFPATRIHRLRRTARSAFSGTYRVHSLSGWIRLQWTGVESEDTSTASASGLLALNDGTWDADTLKALDLPPEALPPVVSSTHVVGELTPSAAADLGLPPGLPVVAGAGDGFLATLGSGCDSPERLAITLGTTSAVRTFINAPIDGTRTGMFCYRFAPNRFLAGYASNNGGNVLEWACREFGTACSLDPPPPPGAPLFLPFLHGERAPFWDTHREAKWLEVGPGHTAEDLAKSAAEAVVFVLASYSRRVAQSLQTPRLGLLSGNGFQTPGAARLLASLVDFPLAMSPDAGMATLRGAARIGFEALGREVGTRPARADDGLNTLPGGHSASESRTRFDRFAEAYV